MEEVSLVMYEYGYLSGFLSNNGYMCHLWLPPPSSDSRGRLFFSFGSQINTLKDTMASEGDSSKKEYHVVVDHQIGPGLTRILKALSSS